MTSEMEEKEILNKEDQATTTETEVNQEAEIQDNTTENEPEAKEKKDFFGKKKKTGKKEKDTEKIVELTQKLGESNDKYIRLAAEFDNFRKRTIKEKSDLLKYGAETALLNLIPVVDDFERAMKTIENVPVDDPVKSGVLLIYNKFKEYLTRQGIKEIEIKDGLFNTDEHEAITRFPAPSEELKGKVIDVVEKGYYYHEKVIRFAKVVIGE
ncbi:MAG: nucleotide exchange factor GrpE [Bacteroidetes bacterium HGW-Bacteroidetes-21]|jgi:molecular chaperone GrpE|nr:MAG: nucleotide exchange factor GrpE [Bacteroidetes bacterium HGW-Bacteroidetes-21]